MAATVTRISYTNLVDAGTVSSSSELSTLPDTNVQDNFVAVPWRTDSQVDDEHVTVDLGSALNVTVCGLFGFNFSSSATITHQADSAATFDTDAGSPEYSLALTKVTDQLSYMIPKIVYFLDQTYQYHRISVQDVTNTDGYLELGRWWLGTYWQPTYNFSNGFEVSVRKDDAVSRGVLSGAYGRKMPSYEVMSFGWSPGTNPLPTADREKLEDIYRLKGTTDPIVIVHDAANYPTKTGLYGYFTNESVSRRHGVTTNFGTEGLVFREDIGWNGN